jgi:hypothetical protein
VGHHSEQCGGADDDRTLSVPAWMVEAARLRVHLEAALEYAGGTHTLDDVIEQVYAGHMQFWPGVRSAIVTQIVEHPRKKVLVFFLAGGDGTTAVDAHQRWATRLPAATRAARRSVVELQGCRLVHNGSWAVSAK